MRSALVAALALCAALSCAGRASAQSACTALLYFGNTLTAGQWQSCFNAKQDSLGYVPVNKAGDVMTGRLVIGAPTGTRANFNLTPGTAPTNPVDGDIWVTGTSIQARVNGATVDFISPDIANVTGLGTGVKSALQTNVGSAGAVVVDGGALGTPSSGSAANLTGLPITGLSGLGAGVAAFLANPTSANLAAAVTGETGSGPLVFANSPQLVTPDIGAATAASVALKGSSSGSITLSAPPVAGTNTFKFPAGSTDFSASGGSGQFVKQSSSGAPLTVGPIGASDLPVATTGAFGAVKPDGSTIGISAGVISTFPATKAQQQAGTSNTAMVTPANQLDNDGADKAKITATWSGSAYTVQFAKNATLTSNPSAGVINLTWTVPFASAAGYGIVCGLNQTVGGQTISENYSARLAGSAQMNIRTASNVSADASFSCSAFGRQ